LVRVNPEADVGGTGEARKVGPESIAEIEHGGWKFIPNEPLALGESRGEREVAAGPGTSQFPGDEKKVTRARSCAIRGGFFGNRPEEGNGKKELAGSDGFASDDRKPELFGEERKPPIGLMESWGWAKIGTSGSDQSDPGGGSRCSQIAEGTGQRFSACQTGRGGSRKVNSLHHSIRFEHDIEVRGERGENCAVVTDSVTYLRHRPITQRLSPTPDPEILRGEREFFHPRGGRARRRRTQVLALKREWRRIEGIRLFLVR